MTTLVVKVGGRLLSDDAPLKALLEVIGKLSEQHNFVLVHGGGDIAQEWLQKLQFNSEKIDGVRVTPNEHLPFVTGALAGYMNVHLCAAAKQMGHNAVGLTLGDGGTCKVIQKSAQYGAVGDVSPGKATLLTQLLANDYLPIVSSIATDTQGQVFNVNADDAAAGIAQLLDAHLVLLSDVPGVLDSNKQTIKSIDQFSFEQLVADNTIQGGMVVKVRAALRVSELTSQPVTIASWKTPDDLLALNSDKSKGTSIIFIPTNLSGQAV